MKNYEMQVKSIMEMDFMYEKICIKEMDKDSWKKLRRDGIGGSDAGALMGDSFFSNPMKVFEDKVGDYTEAEETECMRMGNDLEEYVAQRFMKETNLKVRRTNYMYRSKQYPWMIANPDRLVSGMNGVGLECKVSSGFGNMWSQGPPRTYLWQVMHYMIVLNVKEYYLAVFFTSGGFQYYHIGWDEEMANELIEVERDFWLNNVLLGIPPSPDGSHICSDILLRKYSPARKDSQIKLIGFDEKLDKRNELADEIERLQMEQKKIDQEIQMYMQDNEYAFSDRYRISWGNVESTRLDTKRFKKEMPEIYKEYAVTSSSRRFQIKAA